MENKKHRSLATHQSGTVFVVALLLGLLFSFYQIVLDLHQEKTRLFDKYNYKLLQSYSTGSQAAYHISPMMAKQVASGLMSDPAIQKVELKDDFNDVLAVESRVILHKGSVAALFSQFLFPENRIFTTELHQPDTRKKVGELSFSVNGIAAAQEFSVRAINILLFDLFRNVLLASILLIFFYHKLSKPVIDLTFWVRSLQHKSANQQLPGQLRNDELGQLAQSFQALWNERENATEQLNKHIEALAKSEHFASTIMNNSGDALLLINRTGIIAHANKHACNSLGYSSLEMLGKKSVEISVSYSIDYLEFKLKQPTASDVTLFEATHRTHSQGNYPVEVTAIELELDGDSLILLQARDISSRKLAERQIHDLAYFDSLTGLPNRKQLLDVLEETIQKSFRTSEPGVLIYLDLDRFKTINDSLGHNIGDLLLKSVASRLIDTLDPVQCCARIGGDEFVIIVPNMNLEQAEPFVLNLLDVTSTPYTIESHHLYCSVSAGLTVFPTANSNPLDLLRQADTALYRAKAQGSNTHVWYEPEMQNQVSSYLSIEKGLHEALNLNQFELFYQPQVDDVDQMIGAEALIRWRHPDKGLLSPFVFIQIAEETGQIIPIGNWIIEQACMQLAFWQNNQQLPPHFSRLAINISPMQFEQKDFVDQIVSTLNRHGVSPHDIELELTENMLLDNIDHCAQKMAQLKQYGFAIAIDDFGTGYSSLKYLKLLDLDVLKIDRSFITDLHKEKSDEAIVDTMILMAKRLGLEVIAEGVEQAAELARLKELGCKHFQGYFFDKPLTAQEITQRFSQQRISTNLSE
ncbi:EAL domain-containing protein [Vibrio tapetis]|uniref:Putative EAL,GGDEF and PAS domains carrying protein n=1 Tax=Vibrio tapetis subsp. tapetis TaxID=1671868 RepID=A0A2N8ZCC8_9VIBR|nr:EAL domain-containing protein [Vibrio tapetis]SON49549.1 putative EAL,GGDEF and PAS domains carrying protein [Vibrio tapetis subsp. tapetis]